MTLKNELQAIDPENVDAHLHAYDEKMAGLKSTPDEFQAEALASIHLYLGLNAIVGSVRDRFVRKGYTLEEATMATLGASMVVGVLSEIAEAQALPPIN